LIDEVADEIVNHPQFCDKDSAKFVREDELQFLKAEEKSKQLIQNIISIKESDNCGESVSSSNDCVNSSDDVIIHNNSMQCLTVTNSNSKNIIEMNTLSNSIISNTNLSSVNSTYRSSQRLAKKRENARIEEASVPNEKGKKIKNL